MASVPEGAMLNRIMAPNLANRWASSSALAPAGRCFTIMVSSRRAFSPKVEVSRSSPAWSNASRAIPSFSSHFFVSCTTWVSPKANRIPRPSASLANRSRLSMPSPFAIASALALAEVNSKFQLLSFFANFFSFSIFSFLYPFSFFLLMGSSLSGFLSASRTFNNRPWKMVPSMAAAAFSASFKKAKVTKTNPRLWDVSSSVGKCTSTTGPWFSARALTSPSLEAKGTFCNNTRPSCASSSAACPWSPSSSPSASVLTLAFRNAMSSSPASSAASSFLRFSTSFSRCFSSRAVLASALSTLPALPFLVVSTLAASFCTRFWKALVPSVYLLQPRGISLLPISRAKST
mmetsp:Transcript_53197/g.116755  ORF Transcript_53197/g.116755 Transcript_53197/m.116755 type:complete len:347 (+) Transcript_53197:608-1648(+)